MSDQKKPAPAAAASDLVGDLGDPTADGADDDATDDADSGDAEPASAAGAADDAVATSSEDATAADGAAPGAAAAAAQPAKPKASKEFAALARERQKLRAREQAIKGVEDRARAFDDLRSRLTSDPLAVLEAFGIPEDAIIQRIVGRGKPPTSDERVAQLEARLEKEAKERQAAEQQRTIDNWKAGIVAHVQRAGERYDLVNALGMHDLVTETIVAYHRQYGEIVDADTAAAQVEQHLAGNLGKSKKFGQRQPVKQPATANGSANPKRPGNTLSSVQTSDLPPDKDGLSMDEDERFSQVCRSLPQ